MPVSVVVTVPSAIVITPLSAVKMIVPAPPTVISSD